MFLNDILSKKLKENDQRNFNAKLDQLKDHIESVSQQNVSENMADFFANKAKELYPTATIRKDGETLQEPPKREVPKVEPAPVDIEKLKTVLVNLEKKYRELGGDSWQYADRMMPRDYEAQAIGKEINRLKGVIARNSDVAEGSLNEFAPTFGGDDDENIVDTIMSYIQQNYPKAVKQFGDMTVYEVINDRASMGYYRPEEIKNKDLDDLATDVIAVLKDEYDDEGLDEGSEAGAYYYEELAQKVFGENPQLNSSGSASEVLDAAYTIARNDLGDRRARALFTYDEDFPGDLVTAYAHLQKQGVAEGEPAGGWRVTWLEAGQKCTTGLLLKPGAVEIAGKLQKKPGATDVKVVPYNPRSTEVAEGSNNIGGTIKALYQQIYNQGDDALEYLNTSAPLFAQFWDQYEGDLDSIIAEVSPKNLIRIAKELKAVAGHQGVAEGRPSNYKPPKEADYGDDYQDMVQRVADQEKAKQAKKQQQQKKTTNEDISDIIDSRLMRMRRAGYDL